MDVLRATTSCMLTTSTLCRLTGNLFGESESHANVLPSPPKLPPKGIPLTFVDVVWWPVEVLRVALVGKGLLLLSAWLASQVASWKRVMWVV